MRNAAALAAFFVVATANALLADQVTISSGDLTVSGEIQGFDGRYLRLLTSHGEITLDYRRTNCLGVDCPDIESFTPTLRVAGPSVWVDTIVPALAAAYARDRGWRIETRGAEHVLTTPANEAPELAIEITGNSGGLGVAALLANDADVVLSVAPVSEAERQAAIEAGLGDLARGDLARILALDAVVPVVHPSRDMRDVGMDSLVSILQGEIRDWTSLNAGAGPLVPVLPYAPFLPLPADGAAVRRLPAEDIARTVLDDASAFGLTRFGSTGNTQPLAVTGPCGRPLRSSRHSLKTGDYPLTRPVFLYRPARRLAEPAQDFLVWLRSREAQGVIRRAGLVDLRPERIGIEQQGERLASAIAAAGPEIGLGELQRLVRILSGHDRLTPTFRFADGSTRLTPQSRSYLLQVARAIREGQFDGDDLMLVGFSDGRGPALVNRDLSRSRAEAVRRELIAVLGGTLPPDMTISTEAFGEALPIACDEVAWGQNLNRRVELWIKRQGS